MSAYLQQITAKRYGGLADCEVGPLSPGLNVVYGPNEAGKSTVASLVGGVLFGWEKAHGVRNRYLPPDGERIGELRFCDAEPSEGVSEADQRTGKGDHRRDAVRASGDSVQRTRGARPYENDPTARTELEATTPARSLRRDETGVTGDLSVTDDIDRATFDEVFSFSADELRSLRNSSDVTARLLTAASGTGASPASAFVEVEGDIATKTRQVIELSEQLERARERMKRAADREALLKQEDRELRDLVASRAAVNDRIEAANEGIEDCISWRSDLETLESRISELRAETEHASAERRELMTRTGGATSGEAAIDQRLLELDSTGERVLRDRIDELAERQEKANRMLDTAKENSATSAAAYEALVELGEGDAAQGGRARLSRGARLAVSVLLPVVFVAAGVPLFIHGRQIASLSLSALGLGLALSAVILAVAALVVLVRPSRDEAELEKRRHDAQWVMLQDRKKLDARIAEKDQLSAEISEYFESVGLGSANGSIRQACTLLDEAAAMRATTAANDQRVRALDLRMNDVEEQLKAAERDRRRIEGESGIARATVRDLDALVRRRTAERDALVESATGMSERIGELTSALEQAKRDVTFPMEKAAYHVVRARLREAKHDLIELLLAKRMLERSIASWENRSQPEVYAQASRLLSLITGGKWVEVGTSATGSIVATDIGGTVRDPRHLSLGTCQQLYLALRIGLLLVARDVGRAVPVLADDVLVNFDADRRAGAAAALAELAQHRQVIVFTCHRETLGALQAHGATVIPLG